VGPGMHWVRPGLVAEVAFRGWTQHGHLRMPRFQGLRTDKPPRDCRRERPRPAAGGVGRVGAVPDATAARRRAKPVTWNGGKRTEARAGERAGPPAG
jgi:bifunctional non-homologous end joining protein LigD